ncbi:patatin-like phospholipase family protein [Egicoccus sp. AB-alg6-2]|uniref:patatin-like phospholipase family protein n=1 Tax=Egicoccus sp. AB-alg6-2 TaxID=3242692 RepID=UPI00359EA6D3
MADDTGATSGTDTSQRRALILAGGGMRVAWQAGVVLALDEAGLRFAHGDGTSGGILTLGALLSGVSPAELCARWERLDVCRFVSMMPLADYLGGPTNLLAMGDADGIVDHVLPDLGIDVARINACTELEGTFNVCNFTTKTCAAIPHDRVDQDLLVAGISLPLFMPPVEAHGSLWTDAVWVKDANLLEAVRRGADELWLLWCIGNTPRYGEGPLEQYVHMIEMSANGALFAELEQIREINDRRLAGEPVHGSTRPIRLHVVKPAFPLPLDPDFYLGRIDAGTLVAMGYRDARNYLASSTPAGVALDERATAMQDPPVGVRFRERMQGSLALDLGDQAAERGDATLDLTVEIRDIAGFAADPGQPVQLVGRLDHPALGRPRYLDAGTFSVRLPRDGGTGRELMYEAVVRLDRRPLHVRGVKLLRDDRGFDLWEDLGTLRLQLTEGDDGRGPVVGDGELRMGARQARQLVTSVEPTGCHGLQDRGAAVSAFGRVALGGLWDVYRRSASG